MTTSQVLRNWLIKKYPDSWKDKYLSVVQNYPPLDIRRALKHSGCTDYQSLKAILNHKKKKIKLWEPNTSNH